MRFCGGVGLTHGTAPSRARAGTAPTTQDGVPFAAVVAAISPPAAHAPATSTAPHRHLSKVNLNERIISYIYCSIH
jgi:hypothetical protein